MLIQHSVNYRMMKRLLFITATTPGIQGGGGETYTAELLKELSNHFLIDLVYFQYPYMDRFVPFNENIRVVASLTLGTALRIKGMLSCPFVFPYFSTRYNKKLEKKIQELVDQNDYCSIYFDFSNTFIYARKIRHPHIILMAHDVVAQSHMRRKRLLLPWVKATEKELLEKGTAVFTFSEKDCQLVKELYGLESHSTQFFISEVTLRAKPQYESDYYVMFGSWNRPENYLSLQWFISNVAVKLMDDVRIKVLGGGKMPDEIRELIDSSDMFEYVGYVDNPFDIIANARAEIAPLLYGAGVKVKCVEALTCGTPVIGTEVAFEGIPCYEGMERMMIRAKTPEEFIHSIETLQLTIEDRINMKDIFCKNYSDSAIVKYLLSINQ